MEPVVNNADGEIHKIDLLRAFREDSLEVMVHLPSCLELVPVMAVHQWIRIMQPTPMMSSINLLYKKTNWVHRGSSLFSKMAKKMVAHGGAGQTPIPVPEICFKKVSPNLKRLFLKLKTILRAAMRELQW
jgi:hypothetical protein